MNQEAKQIHQTVCSVADAILAKLGKQTNGDVHVAIAALAVAACSLARADGMLFNELQDVLTIAFDHVNAD